MDIRRLAGDPSRSVLAGFFDDRGPSARLDEALKEAVAEQGGMTPEKAAEYAAALTKAGRYLKVVY